MKISKAILDFLIAFLSAVEDRQNKAKEVFINNKNENYKGLIAFL